MSLTINQEKQIRQQRAAKDFREHDVERGMLPKYQALAKCVQLYRRAQRLQGSGAVEARKELLGEIDRHLDALGLGQ